LAGGKRGKKYDYFPEWFEGGKIRKNEEALAE